MNLLRLVDGTPTPVTKRQIRAHFPNVSFPATFPKERMADFDVFVWDHDPQPEYDPQTQRLVEGGWRMEGDEYRRAWVVENLPQGELNSRKDEEVANSVDQLAFKLIFRLNNEVRELKGQQPVNRQQFIAFIRSQL